MRICFQNFHNYILLLAKKPLDMQLEGFLLNLNIFKKMTVLYG